MIRDTYLEYAQIALEDVHLLLCFAEHGKLGAAIENCGCNYELGGEALHWYCFYELMASISDFFAVGGDDYGASTLYFSDAAMREYYTLCREHARRNHIAYRKDPYVKQADEYIFGTIMHGCPYSVWVRISTKTNHEFGVGVAVTTYEDFYSAAELIEALLEVMAYFESAVPALRRELDENRTALAPFPRKEAA